MATDTAKLVDQLGKIGRTAERDDGPVVAGMLRKVRHLVRVEE